MATTADLRMGGCLEHNNDIFQIVDFQHSQTGRGAAFVWVKMKSVRTGRVLEHTFTAGHKVQLARVERRPYQFLYKDDYGYTFMDSNTFEQLVLEEKLVENADLMKDGQEVEISFHAEKDVVLGCQLPQFVILAVTYTEPGLRGDTATNTLKPAVLETGATIQVPLFVNQDDVLKIDTRSRSYVERAKV
jgi:elongation factor P